MTKFENVRGMRDLLPEDLSKRRVIEEKVRECFSLYGYGEIETPLLEYFDLITAKAGDEIRHRLYDFKDHGGRRVSLRPEMTAPVARLLSAKLRSETKPLRLGYIANCFRYDNPQLGRYREFKQAGFELFGSEHPEADSEILIIFHDLMRKLGFKDFIIKIGHIGILKAILTNEGVEEKDQNFVMGLLDKRKIKDALSFLSEFRVSLDCRKNVKKLISLKGNNWIRVITKCSETVCDNDASLYALNNLEKIIRLSIDGGVSSTLLVDLGFTRSLEYYTGMIFEIFVPTFKLALGGGGRYDKLVELFGGEPTPAVGCSPGIDRIVLAMENEDLFPKKLISSVKILVIPVGAKLVGNALKVASLIRSRGISAEVEVSGKSISSALSYADKKNVPFTLIIGPKEVNAGSIIFRDMKCKTQMEIPMENITGEIIKKIES